MMNRAIPVILFVLLALAGPVPAAIDATTVWEVRVDGAQTNGGGYANLDPGTSVDYSQQAAAQLARTNLASDGAGTGISSATGGFTAAMVGNVMYITGGDGFTTGWYQITAYTDANNITIDRTAGASKTGGTGNVGGAFKIGGTLDNDWWDALANGNIAYVKSGEYTVGETMSSSGGSAGTRPLPIRIVGYDTARATRPTADNRPLLTCAAYYLQPGSFWILENLRGTGTGVYVFYGGTNTVCINCKATNTSGTAGRVAFYGVCAIGCEGISTNGDAFGSGRAISCYAHDSRVCYAGTPAYYSIADTGSTYGFETPSAVIGCVAYGCGTGVYTSTNGSSVVNTIISGCTTGVDGSAADQMSVLVNCTLYNTTDLAANVAGIQQVDCQFADPGLNDPANGDFSITSADANVYQLGLDVQVWTSATVR
jgi:hypothetical protein